MSTWLAGKIVQIVSEDTFVVQIERCGGPYATAFQPTERVKMVNNEVNGLRPSFLPQHWQQSLIGMRIYCDIHSKSHLGHYVVTARPG